MINIYTLNSTLKFGKCKGMSLKEVIDNDIHYLNWLIQYIDVFTIDSEAERYINEQVKAGKSLGLGFFSKTGIDDKLGRMDAGEPGIII